MKITSQFFIRTLPMAAVVILTGFILGTLPKFDFIGQAHAACSDSPQEGVNWEGCRKRNLMLSGIDLRKAKLTKANFSSTDMRGSQLDGADFRKSVLLRVAFDGSSAKGAIFEKAIVYRVSFQKSDLTDAVFKKSEMVRVKFNDADLTGVSFSKSEAGRSVFSNARLSDNNFTFANLARADFRKAKISGSLDFESAYFYLTRIEGVDLSAAKNLAQWQIDMACGNGDTILPPGLEKPSGWGCEPD